MDLATTVMVAALVMTVVGQATKSVVDGTLILFRLALRWREDRIIMSDISDTMPNFMTILRRNSERTDQEDRREARGAGEGARIAQASGDARRVQPQLLQRGGGQHQGQDLHQRQGARPGVPLDRTVQLPALPGPVHSSVGFAVTRQSRFGGTDAVQQEVRAQRR